jgi:hypothetical protein
VAIALRSPGIGMGWRGFLTRENADGWPWSADIERLVPLSGRGLMG